MKRSEVDSLIVDAIEFLRVMNFKLPAWSEWSPKNWTRRRAECASLKMAGLGWDITDFGSGDFARVGLLLFTLRNAGPKAGPSAKPYAEKIMVVREGQTTPTHFHWLKREDIINRGGGELSMTLQMADENDEGAFSKKPFAISVDGIEREMRPGGTLRLKPGESVTLYPKLYHSFHAEGGRVMAGEVSSANDDATDNRFHKPCGRFPKIAEDQPAKFRLCQEDF